MDNGEEEEKSRVLRGMQRTSAERTRHRPRATSRLSISLLASGLLLLVLSPLVATASAPVEGELVIVGSGNMAGFLGAMGRGFAREHPDARVKVEARTSSSGPPALLSGRAALASMSRPMNVRELKAFRVVRDTEPRRLSIAVDALAIYVNRKNPLERITLAQLDRLFSSTRSCDGGEAILKWSQLGLEGEWARHSIGLYGHVASAGTHAFFREHALCGGIFRGEVREQPGPRSVILSITESAYGIGYSAAADLGPGVKTLAVGRGSGEPGRPEPEDVEAGAYPLARELYVYRVPAAQDPARAALVDAFLAYALSDAGQAAVAEARFFPLPAKRLAEERAGSGGS
jgi:phosphate transport system substrate-binding protein